MIAIEVFSQSRTDFDALIARLAEESEVIAPRKTDVIRFERVSEAKDIDLSAQAYVPVKEWFFPQRQVIFEFTGEGITVPAQPAVERVFFGLRRCDLAAISHQDIVFTQQVDDPYYRAARERSTLIGYHCEQAPSAYCFCGSLGLPDFFDLMYYDRDDGFLVEVGSEKGRALVDRFPDLFKVTDRTITDEEKVIPGADRLDTTEISGLYDHPGWQQGVDLCLSCGACTSLCPTCYCFELHDEVSMADPTRGERTREWSSCQLPGFTRVAGDHVFRDDRASRFKHRIYHQLDYFKERYGVNMCVGCGRCISGCPTRIDFVGIINEMAQ